MLTRSLLVQQRRALLLWKGFLRWSGRSGQVYFEDRVDEYREIWRRVAEVVGGSFTELATDLWQIDVDGKSARVLNYLVEFDDPVTLGLAGRKPIVHQLLQAEGISVPDYAVFSLEDLDVAHAFLARHPSGCAIKPADGYGGKGVTTHVRRPSELRRAALLASLYGTEVVIEAMIPGESYRLLVLEGRVIDAVRRRGTRVIGDGVSSVAQLVDAQNARRKRSGEGPIKLDRDFDFVVEQQGLHLGSRPKAAEEVLVRSVNDAGDYRELRTVYTEPASELICEEICRDAEAAARLVGSKLLGVDVITLDPSVPLRDSGGAINEVNTTPALHHHYDPRRQAYPEAAVLVLRALLQRRNTPAASA